MARNNNNKNFSHHHHHLVYNRQTNKQKPIGILQYPLSLMTKQQTIHNTLCIQQQQQQKTYHTHTQELYRLTEFFFHSSFFFLFFFDFHLNIVIPQTLLYS